MTKVWLITGTSRGLGRALVEYALEAGDNVVATARNTASLEALLQKYPSTLLLQTLDVTDASAAEKTVSAALEKFDHIDILINNAGFAALAPVETTTAEDFRTHVDTNLVGVFNVTKAALPHVRTRGAGHIFQVSSIGSRAGNPGLGAYQATKWAVSGFATVLAAELRPLGVKVTSLEPGAMQTDMIGDDMAVREFPEIYEGTVRPVAKYLAGVGKDDFFTVGGTEISKVGKVIEALFEADDPPVRLLLGKDAVWSSGKAAAALAASDEKWKELSVLACP